MSKSQQSPPKLRKALGVGVFVGVIYFIIFVAFFVRGGFFFAYSLSMLLFRTSPLILVIAIAGAAFGRWLSKKWYGVWIGGFLLPLLYLFLLLRYINT